MRRVVFTVAILILLTIPLCAQRRGFASHGMGGGSAVRSGGRIGGPVAMRPGGRVVIRGGVGFGHGGVFVGPRRFHHRHVFFNPFFNSFFNPFFSPFSFNSFPLYPYYPYGLQSDFVYSNAAVPQPQQDYSAAQTAALSNEVSRLSAAIDMMRQQQAEQAERQQYALNSPSETPRPIPPSPSARSRQEAPAQPTVLVYRDGRRVEVSNYAVVGQTLWIFSEERARKIPLSELDLEASRQANEARGVQFNVRSPAPAGQSAPPAKDSRPISLSYAPATQSPFAK